MSILSPPLHEVSPALAVGCPMTLAERVISYRYGLPNQLSSPLHAVSTAAAVGCPVSLSPLFLHKVASAVAVICHISSPVWPASPAQCHQLLLWAVQ